MSNLSAAGKCCRIAGCAILFACVTSCDRREPKHGWAGAFFAHPIDSEEANHEFVLFGLEQQAVHLIGTWSYVNYDVRGRAAVPVTIEGAKTLDGLFWPDVCLEVKNEAIGKWETIAKSSNHWWELSKTRDTIVIGRNSSNLDLMVNLDKFQPLIGKYKLGRIVLKSGEASPFELNVLLPPKDEKAGKGGQDGVGRGKAGQP
jgi:hypothetical protein